jgi:hypothetical protein
MMSGTLGRAVAATVCAAALGLAGCSGASTSTSGSSTSGVAGTSSSSGSASASPSGGPALKSADEAVALMADYDTRNNAAIAKAASFDASGWSASDTGLALLTDEMATKLDQARNQAPDGAPLTHTGAVAHAPDVTGALAKQGQLQSAMLRGVCSAAIVIDPAGAATMAGSGCHEIV